MKTCHLSGGLLVALTLLMAWPAAAFELTYEGYVTNLDDAPIDGNLIAEFSLYTRANGGDPIWTEGHNLDVREGRFSVRLGRGNALPEDPPEGLFLEITIEDDVIEPRTPVTAAMYAQRAHSADDVPGRDITPRTVSIEGVGEVIDAQGRWVGGMASTDLDNDGFPDIVEILLGTDPDNRNDTPLDGNDDGIPDALQGTGDSANADEVAALLRDDENFRLSLITILFEIYGDDLRGDAADPQDVAAALLVDDTFRDLLALSIVSDYADQLRGPQGPPGDGGALISPVVLGEVAPGSAFNSLDTPAAVPDANEFGFNSSLFINESLSITRLTVDVEVEHPDAGELSIRLFSPTGTSVLLYDGELAGQEDLSLNIGRDRAPSEGTLDSLFGQNTQGQWRMQVIDNAAGNAGRLISWTLNFNEGWTEGHFFAGESVVSGGDLVAQGELRTERGADFVMLNPFGQEVFRIDGTHGAPNVRIEDNNGNLVGNVVMALSTNEYLVHNQGIYFLVQFSSNRIYPSTVYYENSNCTGNYVWSNSSYNYLTGLPTYDGQRIVRAASRQTRTIRATAYSDGNTCRNTSAQDITGFILEEIATRAEVQALGFQNSNWQMKVGYGGAR